MNYYCKGFKHNNLCGGKVLLRFPNIPLTYYSHIRSCYNYIKSFRMGIFRIKELTGLVLGYSSKPVMVFGSDERLDRLNGKWNIDTCPALTDAEHILIS